MSPKPEPRLINCIDCGGPSGVLAPGKDARRRLIEAAEEHWPDIDVEPAIFEAHVIYASAGQAAFAQERLGCDDILGDCWQVADDIGAPLWWKHSRRYRQATLIDCCSLSEKVGHR